VRIVVGSRPGKAHVRRKAVSETDAENLASESVTTSPHFMNKHFGRKLFAYIFIFKFLTNLYPKTTDLNIHEYIYVIDNM
jgi:hypothetical protein